MSPTGGSPSLLLFILFFPSISSYSCTRPTDCGSSRSGCCASNSDWEATSRRVFEGQVHDRTRTLRQTIHSSYSMLKTHLSSSIVRSHRHLDSLFSTTYGSFYESHAKVFSDLYNDLREKAHSSDEGEVSEVVSLFYRRLFRIVFMLYNPLQEVRAEETECMGRSMEEIEPFGDIPRRSTVHLERTLQGWRQLISALQTTHSTLERLTKTPLSSSCVSLLTRMSVCPTCSPQPLQVCRGLCESTLSYCLEDWRELDSQWNPLVDWLGRLSIRLKEAYSLSATLDALPAMISEAIMAFQEKAVTVTNKVVAKCFMTDKRLGRALREKREGRRDREEWREEGSRERRLSLRQIAVESETHQKATGRMIDSLYDRLISMRGFFSSLPKEICAADRVSASEGDKCWNNEGEQLSGEVKKSEIVAGAHLKGTFVNEGVRLGLLSFRIATLLYGKNYTGYIVEGSGNIDDEDYWESSGDVSIFPLDRPSNLPPSPSLYSLSPSLPSLLLPLLLLLPLF